MLFDLMPALPGSTQDYFTMKVYSLEILNRRGYITDMAASLVAISESIGDTPDTLHFSWLLEQNNTNTIAVGK